ncbi:MAG: DNA-3-methyladenine glycosylase family protein [Hyphomicrobium sp.]
MAHGRRAESKSGGAFVIETAADIARGVAVLRRRCPHMRRLHDRGGDPPLRRWRPGFEGLVKIVVGQQLSTASADAIWRRTVATVQPLDPATLLAVGDSVLRAAGLSGPKIRTLRAVAGAIVEGRLDIAQLDRASDTVVREALTAVSGIGPWTSDIYLMFCLGRADSWAPGDLALQLAIQSALSLEARPGPAELERIAERWRPWRAVAARLLWADYSAGKTHAGTTTSAREQNLKRQSKTVG